MNISFIKNSNSYLPELDAYKTYIENNKLATVNIFTDANQINCSNTDFAWIFCGIDRIIDKNILRVHEYHSLSTPPFAYFKDLVKKQMNKNPIARIFLNTYVHDQLGFTDNAPVFYRDMGISDLFFKPSIPKNYEFDFIYIGQINRTRNIDQLLLNFKGRKSNILLIGTPSNEIYNIFKTFPNVKFYGRVEQNFIPEIARSCRAGINYIPNLRPYSMQTSTKLLEYCALKIPVVTTKYPWVYDFAKSRNANFVFVDAKFNPDDISVSPVGIPDVTDLSWDKVISTSGIFEYISSKAY